MKMATLKMNFLSKALGMQTNITVILPSYSFADVMGNEKREVWVPGMKFQTLWLLHGFSGDDSDYVNFTNIVRYADQNKLAVVMPPAFNASYTDEPQGAKYFSFVVDELPEMCRALFPLSDKREDNIVAGLSMGGGGAMKVGIMRPEQYGTVMCMSGASLDMREAAPTTSIVQNNGDPKSYSRGAASRSDDSLEGPNDVFYHAKKNVEDGKLLPKFYMTCGDKDFALTGVKKATEFLKENGYDVFYEEVPGYGHEWDFWDLTLRKALNDWFPLKRSAIYPEK